uniref:Uncharacterized protein n=1 Tax=Setaria italica TaxID=4555 RepID=K3ZL27_SETIT
MSQIKNAQQPVNLDELIQQFSHRKIGSSRQSFRKVHIGMRCITLQVKLFYFAA